jgi:hypothetical protein
MEMLSRLLAFALAHLAGLVAGQGSAGAALPGGSGCVEHFALELVPSASDALGALGALEAPWVGAEEVGLAVLRQRREGCSAVLEWELRFAVPGELDTRVHHVEVEDGAQRKLVWREYRPGAGRTLFLEELADDLTGGAELRTVEWGGRDGLREEVAEPEGGLFPLELLERARAGRLAADEVALFEPLEGRFEPVEIQTRDVAARPAAFAWSAGAGPAGPSSAAPVLARTLELRRRDGSLAGAYRFAGSELVAFQWQAGGARGRRISAEEWLRRTERLDQADASDRP